MTTAIETHTTAEPDARGIWQLGIAFFGRKTILTAAELGVFTLCSRRGWTGEELRQRLELHPRGTRDFLDALVSLGMLQRDGETYRASAVSAQFLDPEKPSYLGRFLRMADARWDRLAEGLRTGEPQNGTRNTAAMFTEQYRDAGAWRSYMVGMDYLNAPLATRLAEKFDWSTVKSFVDVGGARGNIAARLVKAHPHLKGGVFDLPPVHQVFDEHMAQQGLSDKIVFHEGDFFNDPLPSADVLMFGHVLHDWPEAERRTLVARAGDALGPGGTLLIYDPMIDDDRREKSSSLLVSLNMLLATPGGSEYTTAECDQWLSAAGFTDISSVPLDDHDTLVIARKS